MATYTTNYNLEKPAQTDIYNVDVFNANADKIDAGLTDKAEKTMLAPVETTNSASRSYAKGEYFVYNNVLCCATTAIAAGGTIAIGTNCSTAPVGGELKSLRDALSPSWVTSGCTSSVGTLNPAITASMGKLRILSFTITLTSNVAKWGVLFTTSNGYPIQTFFGVMVKRDAYQSIRIYIGASGEVFVSTAVSSGETYDGFVVYMVQ